MFDFVKQVGSDFLAASSIEQIGFLISLSGLGTLVGACLAFFGLRNRRAVIDALRRDAVALQAERDKAERKAAAARAEIRLWKPGLWLEEAEQYQRAGNEEKAIELVHDAFERVRPALARATRALAGHHLSQIVGPDAANQVKVGEDFARLSSLLDPDDSDAAFLLEDAILARTDGSLENLPLLPASFAPTDLGELRAVVNAINSKGQDSIEAGSYRLALRLFRRSLLLLRRGRMIEGSLGQIVRRKVAQCLFFCCKFEQAEKDASALLAEQEERLKKGDVDLLRTRVLLADIINIQGRYESALALNRETIAAAVPVDKQDEVDVLAARAQQAMLLTLVERPQEALDSALRLLPRVSGLCGADHPNTLATRHHIVCALAALDRTEEALAQLDDLLRDQTRVFGDTHPYVVVTRLTQADALAAVGENSRAINTLNGLIPDISRALGEDHPHLQKAIVLRDELLASESVTQ